VHVIVPFTFTVSENRHKTKNPFPYLSRPNCNQNKQIKQPLPNGIPFPISTQTTINPTWYSFSPPLISATYPDETHQPNQQQQPLSLT
jgi:hypothetical protein